MSEEEKKEINENMERDILDEENSITSATERVELSKNIVENNVISSQVNIAREKYFKPAYNKETRKKIYDNGSAHKRAIDRAFSEKETVLDPYTGAELYSKQRDSKMKYGEHWQDHVGEADHIDPLNKIVERNIKNPFLTKEDIKDIANRDDNYQVISRTLNQNSKLGKGGKSQEEWANSMQLHAENIKSDDSIETVKNKIQTSGRTAQKNTDIKVIKRSAKNIIITGNEAGVATACQSAGNVATISGIYNVVACINGEKSASEAITDVGLDASKAGISGYIKGNTLTVLNHTLSYSDSKFIAALGKKNIAGKTIMAVSIVGDTVVDWGNGKITTQECLIILGNKTADAGGSAVGSSVGTALGASLGTMILPGAGTVIGGTVGGAVGDIVGGELCCGLYRNIIDEIHNYNEEERRKQQEAYEKMMKYYAEQKRRKEVNQLIKTETQKAVENSIISIINSGEFQKLCYEVSSYFSNHKESQQRIAELILVSLQIQNYQNQLQEYIDNYFQEFDNCLEETMISLKECLEIEDYNSAISEINKITTGFGKKPLINNTDDFCNKIFGNDKIIF